mgnify:CR=1 FL=1
MIAIYKSMSPTSYRFSLWNVQSDCTLLVVPEKPFKPLEFEVEGRVLVWQNSQGFPLKLAKSWLNKAPKRTEVSPDLFGVSLVQVIHLAHPPCEM